MKAQTGGDGLKARASRFLERVGLVQGPITRVTSFLGKSIDDRDRTYRFLKRASDSKEAVEFLGPVTFPVTRHAILEIMDEWGKIWTAAIDNAYGATEPFLPSTARGRCALIIDTPRRTWKRPGCKGEVLDFPARKFWVAQGGREEASVHCAQDDSGRWFCEFHSARKVPTECFHRTAAAIQNRFTSAHLHALLRFLKVPRLSVEAFFRPRSLWLYESRLRKDVGWPVVQFGPTCRDNPALFHFQAGQDQLAQLAGSATTVACMLSLAGERNPQYQGIARRIVPRAVRLWRSCNDILLRERMQRPVAAKDAGDELKAFKRGEGAWWRAEDARRPGQGYFRAYREVAKTLRTEAQGALSSLERAAECDPHFRTKVRSYLPLLRAAARF